MTSRYFAGDAVMTGGSLILLPAEESHHLLKTMRGRAGDSLIVFGNGVQYEAELVGVEGRMAQVRLGESLPVIAPPVVSMAFAVPWIRGGKTEYVVQKLTEMGASDIVVFQARREVARGDDSKRERLERVAMEACKQCERSDMPSIGTASSLGAAIKQVMEPSRTNCYILHEREGDSLSRVYQSASLRPEKVLFASGPEGGWDDQELAEVRDDVTFISLGARILRAETAPIVAAAALLTLSGEI